MDTDRNQQESSNVTVMVECALMIALGTILAQIKVLELPQGGSVTAASMLPFILISFRHGTKRGLISGIANSLLQMLLGGIHTPPAGTFSALVASIVLDYLIAFIALGLAQAFSKPFGSRRRAAGVVFGTFTVCLIRFLCSFVSGFLVWSSLAAEGFGAVIYSLAYNASYMAPETLISVSIIFLLYRKAPQLFGPVD